MKTSSFRLRGLPVLAGCVLALASCGTPYESRSYVYGTAHRIYSTEPVPAHVTVVDADGNAITSGYANRNSHYFNRRYYGNRYYGGVYYGYNNTPYYY